MIFKSVFLQLLVFFFDRLISASEKLYSYFCLHKKQYDVCKNANHMKLNWDFNGREL